MIGRKVLILCTLFFLLTLAKAQIQPKLTIGSEAPSLDVFKWLKGDTIDEFKSDRFYVIEFWATWCVPCIQAMPHLSELAEKYKDQVEFIGISVREGKRKSVAEVEQFVSENSEKMRYAVAMDNPETNIIFSRWMESAGLGAIPATFVLDKEGRVAWIGHPEALESILEELVNSPEKFDRNKAKDKHDKDFYQQYSYSAMKKINELLSKKNYGLAWEEAQKAVREYPDFEYENLSTFLIPYLNSNTKEALEYVNRRSNDSAYLQKIKPAAKAEVSRQEFLHEIARLIAIQTDLDDYAYMTAIPYLKNQIKDTSENYNIWQMYAQAMGGIGEYAIAIEAQEKAIRFFKKSNSYKNDELHIMLVTTTVSKMEDKLNMYQSLANQKYNLNK